LTVRTAWIIPLLCAAAVSGCCDCDDDDRPARLTQSETPPLVVACSTLRTAGFELEGTSLLVDQNPAACASDGMSCPIEQTEQLAEAADCEPVEEVFAFCDAGYWRLSCADLRAGSTPDGGGAGAAGSGA
jgi:hypothetical protein